MEEVVESHNRQPNPLPSPFYNMNTVVINGKTFRVNGRVSILKNKVVCNGDQVVDLDSLEEKEINISINGDVEKIDVDACDRIEVTGNVDYIKTMSGDIEVHGDVTGDVKTMSGDIDCGNVGGNASTMSGDVRRK